MMALVRTFSYLILLCLATSTIAASLCGQGQYIIKPSQQSRNCVSGSGTACSLVDNDLTLSQFVSKSSEFLTNDTMLIFCSGSHSLESELIVENVHSFSMFVWPVSSSKAVITCHGQNARFEFSNVSTVTVSGLEFVGCFENHVISVGHFQLENSGLFGNGQAMASSTVLSIEESTANLDRVVFTCTVLSTIIINELLTMSQELTDDYQYNCSILDQIFSGMDRVTGISSRNSSINITHSQFEGNNLDVIDIGAVISVGLGSDIVIINTTFVNNSASDLYARYVCRCYSDCNITSSIVHTSGHGSTVKIYDSKFMQNEGVVVFGKNCDMLITHTSFIHAIVCVTNASLVISHSTFTNNTGPVLNVSNTDVNLSHGEFISNQNDQSENGYTVYISGGMITDIDHSKFIKNTENGVLGAVNTNISISQCEFTDNENQVLTAVVCSGIVTTCTATIDHSKFINNTAADLGNLVLNTDMIILRLNEFIENSNTIAVVYIPYYTTAENLTDNVFTNNQAAHDLYICPSCRPGLSLSLGSSRCIQCSEHWHRDLIGIVVAAFIAGIALVIFMLALNMTVAIGTLNGILFYANIVAANADTYFLSFMASNFVTVFISWLNLDIGFDVCFKDESEILVDQLYKALLQLAFPVYVIVLVIIVIVASECSSKFAKIIGKGNPVAVLDTMILISCAKLFNAIFTSFSLLYYQPAYGSRNVDVTKVSNVIASIEKINNIEFTTASYVLFAVSLLIFLFCIIFIVLVFSWQWLLRYQDKVIFKWVRHQKLHLFLEPYHTPYTAKYRYWTGLLLFVRVLLYLISLLNFTLDPRVGLMATIFIVGGLILLKGVTAKRVYKNWPLDVMETAIYFNLVTFSALMWYNLDFGGDQVAVAYTSVMIIFILLLGVIVFHVLRYTRLYKCSFVEKAFKWISSKLLEKNTKEHPLNDAPEELDGYRLVRSASGTLELPTVTYSVVEIR